MGVTFSLEVHLVATKLLPIETGSKVATSPLASGDPQALALDLAGPLIALCVLLYKSSSLRFPHDHHYIPLVHHLDPSEDETGVAAWLMADRTLPLHRMLATRWPR